MQQPNTATGERVERIVLTGVRRYEETVRVAMRASSFTIMEEKHGTAVSSGVRPVCSKAPFAWSVRFVCSPGATILPTHPSHPTPLTLSAPPTLSAHATGQSYPVVLREFF